RGFGTVDLCPRYTGDRAGVDDRCWIDAQFRSVAQCKGKTVVDQIVWRLDQKFGIGPKMQGVIVSADDLTSDTGSRAELLRRAMAVGAGGRMYDARGRPGRIGPGPEDVIVPTRSNGGSLVARRNI